MEYIIGKLPEICCEWQYAETILKEKGFDFKDKSIAYFAPSHKNLEEFVTNLQDSVDQIAESSLGVKPCRANIG